MKTLVCGAGGFIGGHLVNRLIADGVEVVAVDVKPLSQWWQINPAAENRPWIDLSLIRDCQDSVAGVSVVYNLAASMGGMNFITNHPFECMLNVLINTHMLQASIDAGVERFFFSGSACCYNGSRQEDVDSPALKESDAFPAMPDDGGYGWEKLFSELMCEQANASTDLIVRTARFHNVFGPFTSFDDMRGKAPATLSRKVAEVINGTSEAVEVWGDGLQQRSFMYIDDCLKGILDITALTDDEYRGPMNLGSSELVSINGLVSMIGKIAGLEEVPVVHNLDAPQGVRGRNSDNTLIMEVLGWQPSTPLVVGLESTYRWVFDRLNVPKS